MTPRERTLAALDMRVPDRVPSWDWFDEAVTIGVADRLGLASHDHVTTLRKGDETLASLDLYCRVVEALGVDATSMVYNTGLKPVTSEYGEDKYGRGYLFSDYGMPAIIKAAAANTKEFRDYDMVSRLEDSDFDGVRHIVEQLPDRAHCLNINGPFQEAWNLTGGLDKLLYAFLDDPDYAHGALRIVSDFNKAVMTKAAEIGVDFVVLDGDVCGNQYPLMSPEHFRSFIVPYKKEHVEHARALGLKIVKHTDGNAWAFMDDLIDLGFDAFHPVQPQCMDLAQTKAYTFGKLALFGNVDCLDLLVFKGPEETRAETKRVIELGSPGGGHVLSSSNSLHPGCKPENVIAMFETVKEYGDYELIAAAPAPADPPPVALPNKARQRTGRRHVRAM